MSRLRTILGELVASGLAQLDKNELRLTGRASEVERMVKWLRAEIAVHSAAIGLAGPERVECFVCFDTYHPNDVLSLGCGHAICSQNCLPMFVQNAIGNNDVPLKCSAETCGKLLGIGEIREALSIAAVSHGLLAQASLRAHITKYNATINPCPTVNCCGYVSRGVASSRCLICQTDYCGNCPRRAHAPHSCREMQRREDLQVETKANEAKLQECLAQLGGRKCPRCGHYVIKESGCNAMSCRCGCGFCYLCGTDGGSDAHPHFGMRLLPTGQPNPCYAQLFQGVFD